MDYNSLTYPEQKRTILKDLNKFVNHSDIVYKRTNYKGMRTAGILNDIAIIKGYVCDLNKFNSLHQICLKIFQLKKRLFKILPHPNNVSYEPQYNALVELTNFATDTIKPKPQITQALKFNRKPAYV